MKKKKLIIYLSILFIISLIIGFIYGINNNYDITNYIKTLTSHNNMYIESFLIIIPFFIFTISLIGIVFGSILISFEGMSIGYILSLFFYKYKLKGILYFIYVFIINKLFFLVILVYLFYVSYKFFNISFNNLIGNSKDYFINIIKPLLLKYIIIIISVLIYDTFIYFFGNKILYYLIT